MTRNVNMDIQEYLQQLITTIPAYSLLEKEQKTIQFEGIEKYIYQKISSSKFKASSIPLELDIKIKQNIHQSVTENLPIHFTIPFGGYKKWQLPSYPLPDWAELFNLILMRDYVAPIAAAYQPGVIIEYFSDEIFISRMNNYPQADLDQYNAEFKNLVTWFSQYLPKNVTIKCSKIRDQISQEELMKRFDVSIEKLRTEWNTLSNNEQQYRLNKSLRNYKADLSTLPVDEKNKILLESTLVHDAFIFGDWETGVPWAFGEKMIPIGFRYTGTWGLHLRSSASSTVQFWIGIGALKKHTGGFSPTILTYQQYLQKNASLRKSAIELIPLDNSNLNTILIDLAD